MEIQGVLLHILPVQQISESFSKRDFILQVNDGKFDQEIQLELHGSNTDIIDAYGEGEEIKVTFNLRGKKFSKEGQSDRWFNSLIAWKLERV